MNNLMQWSPAAVVTNVHLVFLFVLKLTEQKELNWIKSKWKSNEWNLLQQQTDECDVLFNAGAVQRRFAFDVQFFNIFALGLDSPPFIASGQQISVEFFVTALILILGWR